VVGPQGHAVLKNFAPKKKTTMIREKRDTILDRARPSIKTPAIGVIAQQGINGKWTTAVQKELVRIGTVNVGTMRGRSREVVEMLARRGVDICCVQETQYKGEGCTVFGEGEESYKFYWKGEIDKRGGVGILIREELSKEVVEIKRITDRIIKIKVVMEGNLIHVISAYAPQGGKSQEEKEEFWGMMDDSIGNIPENEILVIGGDLNGHVGKDRNSFEDVMGIDGYGERNADGEIILEICQSRQLKILNTMFKKKDRHKITYKSGNKETQVDYILARKNDKIRFKDCKVALEEECLTQHRLLCSDIRILGMKRKRKRKGEKKIKVWKLKDESVNKEFEKSYEKRAESLKQSNKSQYEKTHENSIETGREICGETTGHFRIKRETWWWNEKVQQAIKEKKKAYKKWQQYGSEVDKEAYKQKRKEAKKIVASIKAEEYKKWEENKGKPMMKTDLYKIAKQKKKDRQDITGGKYVMDKKGDICVNDNEIMDRWREYFMELLNEQNDYEIDETTRTEVPLREITEVEVEAALKGMSKGKAAGPSGLRSELLQAAGKLAIRELSIIFNDLLEGKEIPKDWKDSITIPIYKGKGDAMDCGNYRGVRLLEHGMKVYEYVLERRLREIVDIGDYQFGFRQGRSTTGAIFIVRQLQEKYNQKKRKLYHIFIDLEKAFDRVPRKVIEWALRRKMVPERMVKAIMALYAETRTRVKTAAGVSKDLDIGVGVHQGSILSPLLFIVVMDEATKDIRIGVPWELGYADDLVLTAESEHEVWKRFVEWRKDLELRGLKVNIKKTKMMVTGKSSTQKIKTGKWPCGCCGKGVGCNSILCTVCKNWCHKRCSGLKRSTGVQNFKCPECRKDRVEETCDGETLGGQIEVVQEFCYLGDVLDCEAGVERAVRARVSAAWREWRVLASVLTDKRIPLRTRASVYEGCIRSVMLYGSETWALTQKDEDIMRKCDRRMLRYMTGVKWQDGVSSEEVAERCGLEDIQERIRQGRLQWFGHVRREGEEGVLRMVEKMQVTGNRLPGRPKGTLEQLVQGDLKGKGLKEEQALDRKGWKRLIAGPQMSKRKERKERVCRRK